MMRHLFTALVIALLLAVPRAAFADGDDSSPPDFNNASGWENTRAPTATHFNLYTEFIGTKDQFQNNDLDTWLGVVTFSAEVAIPGAPVSVFADIGYQLLASGSAPTGWKDPNVGAKFSFSPISEMMIGVYVTGNIPIGTKAVTLEAFEATSIGIAGTLMIGPLFGNAGMDFGAVWKILTENSSTKAFQWRFYIEGGINPGAIAKAKLGLEGVLRTDGFETDQFEIYAEGQVFLFFLRVTLPFDLQGGPLEGVKTAFETGTLKILFGISLYG